MGEAPSDEDLVRAWIGGDEAAFRALYERYAPQLTRIMRRTVSREQDIQDIVQQTFLNVHRARKDFDLKRRFRPWIMTIALNVKREHFRRKQRRPEHEMPEYDLPDQGDGDTAHSRLERMAEAEAVRAALATLSEGQRTVIELHWFGENSFAEVAEIVGANVSAVKVRAHRGYKQLRMLLVKQ